MIRTVWECDLCGKELKPSFELFNESQTKVWDMRQFMFCKECASKIDAALLAFKVKYIGEEGKNGDRKVSKHDLDELASGIQGLAGGS